LTKGIVPSLVLFLAVVVAAVPWALPSKASFILPLLLIIIVYVLTLQRRTVLPSLSVFAAGLLMDILTAGPLGYWAIIFLLTHTLAALYGRRDATPGFGMLWLVFAATAVVTSISGWVLASLYFVRVIDWQPMLIGGAVAVALFPLVAWPMRRSLGLVPAGVFAKWG
jgi:rod shape-determining protein MreD